jgi:hypothetical protein
MAKVLRQRKIFLFDQTRHVPVNIDSNIDAVWGGMKNGKRKLR